MGPSVGCAGPSANRSTSMPLNSSSYVAAERSPGRGPSRPATPRTRWSSRAAMPPQAPTRGTRYAALSPGGVEGARPWARRRTAAPSCTGRARAARGGGRRRSPRRAARGSCAAGRTGRGRAAPPSRWRPSGTLRPSGVTPASGGGPSHGAEHAHLVAERAQRAGEPEHLALHAAGDGQGVRADQPDAHRRRLVPDLTTPEAADHEIADRRPVGLEEVPLLGGPADQVLEGVGEVLGDPLDVVAELALAGWCRAAGSTTLRRRSGPSK